MMVVKVDHMQLLLLKLLLCHDNATLDLKTYAQESANSSWQFVLFCAYTQRQKYILWTYVL